MSSIEGDLSYSPDAFRILPRIAGPDLELIRLANRLTGQMHPLNADAQFAKIEAVLTGLSGHNTDPHLAATLRSASDTRDAMKRMGAGRRSQGLHPVPEDLQHLLPAEDRATSQRADLG